MFEDPDLKAYAVTLRRSRKLPLASKTYLDLAERRALYGGRPTPIVDEGARFAAVLLAPVMPFDFVETDMKQPLYTRLWADSWWRYPNPNDLLTLKQEVEESAAAWDILQMICADAVKWGRTDLLPLKILLWRLGARYGRPKRPDPKPAPPNRPSKVGYRQRDNEIRNTVRLLEAVGMKSYDGCKAVAEAFPYYISLVSVRRIFRESDWTPEDIARNFEERYQLEFYPTSRRPDSNSGPTG